MSRTTASLRAAVLGSPVAHSLSPALHRAAYRALDLPWTYDRIEVDEDGLPEVIASLDESWAGLSLTMPLKERVLGLVDRVTDRAREVEAANTVLVGPDGLTADNTDVTGIVQAIRLLAPQSGADAAVIGAGATARSSLAALRDLGVTMVSVVARRQDAARDLAGVAERLGLGARVLDWSDLGEGMSTGIVVSTLPGDAGDGLAGHVPSSPGVLLDVAYSPWPPPLTAAWRSRGGAVATGLDMLLWQAVEQVRLMTGLEPPIAAMREALPH